MSTDHPRPRTTCRSRTRVHTPQGELQQLKALLCPGHPSMVGVATFRLSTSPLHRHCYSSQQDELRTRIAGQRACRAGTHLPCSQASVRTGPAGIPVRGYVDVLAHTREAREPRAYRSCAPLPTALPPRAPSQFRTVGKKFAPNCPTPQTLALFSGPHKTLGVCGELMSNISATRGHPGMRICVCGSQRGDLSHIPGLTLGRSTERFSGANRRPQDHTCVGGVGLTQQIA